MSYTEHYPRADLKREAEEIQQQLDYMELACDHLFTDQAKSRQYRALQSKLHEVMVLLRRQQD